MQTENYFQQSFTDDKQFSSFDEEKTTGKANGGLWEVDDRTYKNPTMRFKHGQSSFVDMIYEGGGQAVLEGAPIPEGLVKFLEQRFLPPLNVKNSEYSDLEGVVGRAFHYLDWEEPYFFLVDMPISLTQENYKHTYKTKRTSSILDPEKIETFRVQRGWKFPHYSYAHKIMTDPRTAAVSRGEVIPNAKTGRPMHTIDILDTVCQAVFGTLDHLENMVDGWMENYFEDLVYDTRVNNPAEAAKMRDAKETDYLYWLAVTVGIMTWLKSPHGLKFLIRFHPIYYEILEWDEDRQTVAISKDTDGWALVDGWTVYTGRDIELLPAIPPGTCSVSKQQLHCTARVNVHAVMKPCYCGSGRRDYFREDFYSHDSDHHTDACRRWEKDHPEAQMAFISYAALDNIVSGRDLNTKCQRFSCPNTVCSYHAGNWARIRALTDNRTKMLTGGASH